jgi:hypothetical protein
MLAETETLEPQAARLDDPQETEGVDYLEAGYDACKAILESRGAYNLPKVCGKLRCEDARGNPSPYCLEHHRRFNTGFLSIRRRP